MKIVMVCLGNICRSPMAEGVLRSKVESLGLDWHIDSAGTSNFHIGEAPDQRAIKKMGEKGVDISTLKARQFDVSDFDNFDHILVMDESNFSNVLRLAPDSSRAGKVKMIMDFVYPGERMSVPDPYYGGDSGFENVFRLLDEACDQFIQEVKQ